MYLNQVEESMYLNQVEEISKTVGPNKTETEKVFY